MSEDRSRADSRGTQPCPRTAQTVYTRSGALGHPAVERSESPHEPPSVASLRFVDDMLRNQWTLCAGINGRIAPERADGFAGIRTQPSLSRLLRELKQAELHRLVMDLCDRSAENRSFVEARLGASEQNLSSFKRRIEQALYPDPMSSKRISLVAARKAVSDYQRATGDARGVLDLMLYYVECGTEEVVDLGMDDRFCASLESMFDRALEQLKRNDTDTIQAYLPRFRALVSSAEDAAWGLGEYLDNRLNAVFPADP